MYITKEKLEPICEPISLADPMTLCEDEVKARIPKRLFKKAADLVWRPVWSKAFDLYVGVNQGLRELEH